MGDYVAQLKNGVLYSESIYTGPEGHGETLATTLQIVI
jgi:hypothetical protein